MGVRPDLRCVIQVDNLPDALRHELLPALETLVRRVQPEGLWLFGSWARGAARANRYGPLRRPCGLPS